MCKDRITTREPGFGDLRRPVLAIPIGCELAWQAARDYIAQLRDEEIQSRADRATITLGQRQTVPIRVIRQRLRDGLREIEAALVGASSSDSADPRELEVVAGGVEVLIEPYSAGMPHTYLFSFIQLADLFGVLEVLGCVSMCGERTAI